MQRSQSGKGFIKWKAEQEGLEPQGLILQWNYSKVSKDAMSSLSFYPFSIRKKSTLKKKSHRADVQV